jgi:hypothetical protein
VHKRGNPKVFIEVTEYKYALDFNMACRVDPSEGLTRVGGRAEHPLPCSACGFGGKGESTGDVWA